MKRFLKNIIGFGFLILIVLAGYGVFCDYFFQRIAYFPNDNKRMWVMKQTNLAFDYAVIGSSRANGAFDLQLLDSLTKLKGINIAADGSGYVDNYLMLYSFLENSNKIKYLFLQTDNYSFDPDKNFSSAFHVYNFLPFWSNPEFEKAISHYLDRTDRLLFTKLPFLRFYKYNKYFSPIQVISRLRKFSIEPSPLPDVHFSTSVPEPHKSGKNLFGNAKSKSFRINPFDQEYLIKIIELCRKNNIHVFCFRAPDFYFQEKVFINYRTTNEYLRSLLEKENVLYLEPDMSIRKDHLCFENPSHINNYGRFIYTTMFSRQVNMIFQNPE